MNIIVNHTLVVYRCASIDDAVLTYLDFTLNDCTLHDDRTFTNYRIR